MSWLQAWAQPSLSAVALRGDVAEDSGGFQAHLPHHHLHSGHEEGK